MEPAIVNFLANPKTHGRWCENVRTIQTHASVVFLTGRFAYKVKKPVDFGFLDYTTLEKRKHFCDEELRLNRRLAPDLYLEVVPIVRRRGLLELGGKGEVVEYAVKMKELPQDTIMTERLRQNAVGYRRIDELARLVSDFHRSAETGPEVEKHGSRATVQFNWQENFDQTRAARGKVFPRLPSEELEIIINRFLQERESLFADRVAAGRVRQCHGDLHSGNIFINDRIEVFDCIEFNPRFSCCDTASEVAFLVMDLDFLGFRDLGQYFVERYTEYADDPDLVQLLDFYRSYRAFVRAKVTSFKLADPGIPDAEKAAAQDLARRYFERSASYARSLLRPPFLVIVMGLPGVGKTYFAQRLADRLNTYHYMSDAVRKQLAGMLPEDRASATFEAGLYSSEMSERTYAELNRRAGALLDRKFAVIIDATFNRRDAREQALAVARTRQLPAFSVFCFAPEEVVLERIARRSRAPSASDATPDTYYRMRTSFETPAADFSVDTSRPLEPSLELIASQVLARR